MSRLEERLEKSLEKIRSFIRNQKYIRVAYIFGSAANGELGPLSDIDFAFLLDRKLSKSQRSDKHLFLINKISEILNTDKFDVVIMNDTDYAFNYEVIKTGILLFSDEAARIDFETRTMSEYLDRRYYDLMHMDMFLDRVSRQGRL